MNFSVRLKKQTKKPHKTSVKDFFSYSYNLFQTPNSPQSRKETGHGDSLVAEQLPSAKKNDTEVHLLCVCKAFSHMINTITKSV